MIGLAPVLTFASADRHSHRMSPDDIGRLIVSYVAKEFALDSALLMGATRGPPDAALARQVAMYLAHVAFALNFATIGRVFGRDRTTVAHACRVIENRRDDRAFDRRITVLEMLCCSACGGDQR